MPPYAPVACELVMEGRPPRKKASDEDTLTAFDPAELGRVVDARVRELTDRKRRHETGGMDHDDIAHKIGMGPSTLWDIRLGKGGRGFRDNTLRRLSRALWPPEEYPDYAADYLVDIFKKPIPRDFGVLKREISAALEPQFKSLRDRLDTLHRRLDVTHGSHVPVELATPAGIGDAQREGRERQPPQHPPSERERR